MRRIILAFLAALLLLPGVVTASASGGDVLSAQSEALELDGLEDAAGDWLPGVELEAGLSLDEGLQSIVDTGSGELFGVVRKAVRSGVLVLAVVLLCGLAEGLYAGTGAGRAVDVVSIAGALAVAAVAAADANTLIGLGREALDNMSTFSKLLLPTVTAAAAAAGSPGGAVARQLATMLFSDVLITLITQLLLPLVYAYIAACVAHAAVGNEGLKRIAGTLKWLVTAVLTTVLVVFVGYLTVSGGDRRHHRRGDRQGGQVHHVQPGAGGGRHPVRRGGDRAGRGGHPEKRGGGVRHAGGAGHVRGALPPAGDPLPGLQGRRCPQRHRVRRPGGRAHRPAGRGLRPGAGHDGLLRPAAAHLPGVRHHGGGEVRPCWS